MAGFSISQRLFCVDGNDYAICENVLPPVRRVESSDLNMLEETGCKRNEHACQLRSRLRKLGSDRGEGTG